MSEILVGAKEIAMLVGVTRQWVNGIAQRGFPDAVGFELANVKRVAAAPVLWYDRVCNQEGRLPPMAKHDRRKSSAPPDLGPVTIQVPLPVLGVVHGVREAFHGLCIAAGLQVLEAMMDADRAELCGPKGRHQVERSAWRAGVSRVR